VEVEVYWEEVVMEAVVEDVKEATVVCYKIEQYWRIFITNIVFDIDMG